jgi:CheY-like chemotaxis protein
MNDSFLDDLRAALNSLFNLSQLAQNPLCRLFNLKDPFESPAQLQRILKDALSEQKPKYGEPRKSSKWQIYELLSLRYLQQFSQKEVASQLGISISKLNRMQQTAIETLAIYLWEKYDLNPGESLPALREKAATGETASSDEIAPVGNPSEYFWAARASVDESTSLSVHLEKVIGLIQPLLDRYAIRVEQRFPADLPGLMVHPLALQQIMINSLTCMVQYLQSGLVRLQAERWEHSVRIEITGSSEPSHQIEFPQDVQTNLKIAGELASVSGGKMTTSRQESMITIQIELPSRPSVPILVVDDSKDFIRLVDHFVENAPYRLYSETDPHKAIDRAKEVGAMVLIVDVMMPGLDGWNLLQFLRNDPGTTHIPVVVSSILRQEELALLLGADAFLPKPVNQQDFLLTLARLTVPRAGKPDLPIE